MRRFAPLVFSSVILLLLATLPVKANPDAYTDDSFTSPSSLEGVEVVAGDVRLKITPESWTQTTKADFEQWKNDENVAAVDPGFVKLTSAGDNWVWVKDTVTGTYGEAVVGTGENIYITRGSNFYRYRPANNSWTELAAPPQPDGAAFKTGTALTWDNGNYIYAMFGAATGDVRRWFYRYSISGNSWEALENTPDDQGEGDAIAWVGLDNRLYATIGGEQRWTYFARYDPSTNTWDEAAVSDPHMGMGDGESLVWTGNNYLYALQGEYKETEPLYGFWRYDIATDSWGDMEPIPAYPHSGGVGGVGDGGSLLYIGLWLPQHSDFIYALSGNQAYPEPIPDNRFYRYTISTNSWERLADLPFGIGNYIGCRLAYADGHIYAWQGGISTWAGGGDDLVRYEFPLYLENGMFTSNVFDAGVTSTWQEISWDASSPAGVASKRKFVGGEPQTLVDGENRLGSSTSQGTYGSQFAITSSSTTATKLESSVYMISIRFVAQKTGTLDNVSIRLSKAGDDLDWTFRLENDDGSAYHYPSGALAWAGAQGTVTITASGFVTVDIANGTLENGKVYHVVIVPENTPDENNYINPATTSPFNETWIGGTTTNSERGVCFYNGSVWTNIGREPVYVLDYADGTYEGDPYYTYPTKKVYGDNYYGEQFVQSATTTITEISFFVRRYNSPPDNLYVELYDDTGAIVVENGSLGDASTVGASYAWHTYSFSVPRTLSVGDTYRIYLKSPGSTSDNYYAFRALDTLMGAPYPSLTYEGTNSVLWENDAGGVSTKDDQDAPFVFTTHVSTAADYQDTRSRDDVYENISEENTVPLQTWTQTGWSGGATGTPPAVVTGTTTQYTQGENENVAGGENITLSGFFWEDRAGILAYGRGVSAVYAENGGIKYIYAVRGSATRDFYRYQIDANTWENLTAAVPATLLFDDGAALVWTGGDNIYALRGDGTDNFYRYSVSNDTWTACAGFPPLATDSSSMVWTGGDNIYLLTEGVDNLWRYSIADDSWSIAHADLPALPKDSPTMVWTGGDNIYINLGGSTAFRRYSISDNNFASLTGLFLATGSGASMAQVGSYIYCARGASSTEFYRYDIGADSWENIRSLPATVGTNDGNRLVRFENYLYMIRGVSTTAFWRFALYSPSGYLESSILDAGEEVVWGTISFDNFTPAGTSLVAKVRVSENDNNPYDGAENWSAWQVFSSGDDLPYENRYLQYRIEFSTTNNNLAPTFKEVSVTYSAYKYSIRWEHRITGVENTYENVKLRIYGYNATGDENIGVYIWRSPTNEWVFIDNLDNGSAGWVEYSIDNISNYLVGDNISIKFEDADNTDATQTTILIDYAVLEAQKPYSTSVVVESRTSADNGAWSDWKNHQSGDDLPYENRYFQYRVELSTDDEEATPMLHEIVAYYVPRTPRTGTFTSQPLELGYVESWGTLSWDAALPENTSISFATRSSPDGSNWSEWEELESSVIQGLTYGRPYLQVRATLQGVGVTSPTLRSYSIFYTPDRAPPGITITTPSEDFSTTKGSVVVSGTLSDSNPATLEVNGRTIAWSPGSFSTQVSLNPGSNEIHLVAEDIAGNRRELKLKGTRTVPPLPAQPVGHEAEQAALVVAVGAAAIAALVAARTILRPPYFSKPS